MKKAFLVVCLSVYAACASEPGISLSATLKARDHQPGELLRIKVTIENLGESEIRVPRRFPDAMGIYPSTRISFTSAKGVEEWSGAPESWPQSRHLAAEKLEESTLKLSGGAFYGTEVLAIAPRALGCYQMKVQLLSWDAPDKTVPDSLLLGDISSAPVPICVTSKAGGKLKTTAK